MTLPNLFNDLEPSRQERFRTLLATPFFTLERIVTTGQATPEGQWLREQRDEWVVLLSGSAGLTFEDAEPLTLRPGDYVLIEAGKRHRVDWTATDEATVWLAIHFVGDVKEQH